jgi:DNA-binding NtrC family response regulator
MTAIDPNVRVLAYAPLEGQVRIREILASIGVEVDFVSHVSELPRIAREDPYQVALLPVSLADASWWSLWGELPSLQPRPAILVYASVATFQLWADVLEAGAYDLVLEPFTQEQLQSTVLSAARSLGEDFFDERDAEA